MIRRNLINKYIILFICSLGILPGLYSDLQAQVSPIVPTSISNQLDSLFTHGHFTILETEALRLLRQKEVFSNEEVIAVYLYLGFVEVLTGRISDAERDFRNALDISPGLKLDRVYIPPAIYEVFERVRKVEIQKDILSKPVSDYSRKNIGLNLILPGSGYIVEKNFLRGTGWISLQTVTLGAFIYSLQQQKKAKENYYNNYDLAAFNRKYEEYNKWHKLSVTWGVSSLVVYVASQLDFIVFNSKIKVEPIRLHNNNGFGAGISWTF